MGKEQRKFPRLEKEFPVFFSVVPSDLEKPVSEHSKKGFAKNISGGGLYLVLPKINRSVIKKLLDRTCKLSMEFHLPDFQHKIKVFAEVRRVKNVSRCLAFFSCNWELGVRFIYIHDEDKDSIIKYVINKEIEDHLTKS